MNLDQHASLQPRIVELQRLALDLAELGQPKASRRVLAAVFELQRIRPTKAIPATPVAAETDAPAKSSAKGKGA